MGIGKFLVFVDRLGNGIGDRFPAPTRGAFSFIYIQYLYCLFSFSFIFILFILSLLFPSF